MPRADAGVSTSIRRRPGRGGHGRDRHTSGGRPSRGGLLVEASLVFSIVSVLPRPGCVQGGVNPLLVHIPQRTNARSWVTPQERSRSWNDSWDVATTPPSERAWQRTGRRCTREKAQVRFPKLPVLNGRITR